MTDRDRLGWVHSAKGGPPTTPRWRQVVRVERRSFYVLDGAGNETLDVEAFDCAAYQVHVMPSGPGGRPPRSCSWCEQSLEEMRQALSRR